MTKRPKQKIKVGFTQAQYEKVHAFLEWLKSTGMVEKEFGTPVKVLVDWSEDNEHKKPHVKVQGPAGGKVIPLKDILEAEDVVNEQPGLKLVKAGDVKLEEFKP